MCGRASSRQAQSRLIRRQGGDGDPRRARRRLNYRRDKRGGDRHPSSLHFMTGGGEGDIFYLRLVANCNTTILHLPLLKFY